MVGWYHWLNGREFEQALGNGEGQGSRACCSRWGRKELYRALSEWTKTTVNMRISWNQRILWFYSADDIETGTVLYKNLSLGRQLKTPHSITRKLEKIDWGLVCKSPSSTLVQKVFHDFSLWVQSGIYSRYRPLYFNVFFFHVKFKSLFFSYSQANFFGMYVMRFFTS